MFAAFVGLTFMFVTRNVNNQTNSTSNLITFLNNTSPMMTNSTQYKCGVTGRQLSRLCHSRGELYSYIIHVLSR